MLQGLMSDMAQHMESMEKEPAPVAVARKQQRMGEDPFAFVAKTLDRCRAHVLQLPPEQRPKVELEARLGIFCRLHGKEGDERIFPTSPGAGAIELQEGEQFRFFSGVTSSSFEHMKATVAKMGTRARHYHEVVYGYPDKQRIRCEGEAMVGVLESKVKIYEINAAMPSSPYDLRLTLALESSMEDGKEVVDGWEFRRSKLRTSYTDTRGDASLGPWMVDFTSVQSDMMSHTGESAEVELELSSEACMEWVQQEEGAAADAVTSRMASRLWDTLTKLNPHEQASPDSVMTQTNDRSLLEAAKQRCAAALVASGGGGRGDKFPGTMPVSMARKDILLIQQGEYWLAEKTDGVRYLLVVVSTGAGTTCVLIERSMTIYTFPAADALGRMLPPGTVLDGELVFNRMTSTYIFLIFDVLFWGADACLTARFTDRLKLIHLRVIPEYEKAVHQGSLPPGHLRLVGKRFYRRANICRLFDRVVLEGGHRVYKDSTCTTTYLHYLGHGQGGKRVQPEREMLMRYFHKTDGIVFQPDAPYVCGTDMGFLKWKWLDTVTIDFAMSIVPYKVHCGTTSGGLDLGKMVRLEEADLMRLRADMLAYKCRIAELAFSPETGYWTYKMLRTDKSGPNFYTTVWSTMQELAEGISEEELMYRMMVDHPAKDDWARQVEAMRKAAVGWQRSQLEHASAVGANGNS